MVISFQMVLVRSFVHKTKLRNSKLVRNSPKIYYFKSILQSVIFAECPVIQAAVSVPPTQFVVWICEYAILAFHDRWIRQVPIGVSVDICSGEPTKFSGSCVARQTDPGVGIHGDIWARIQSEGLSRRGQFSLIFWEIIFQLHYIILYLQVYLHSKLLNYVILWIF